MSKGVFIHNPSSRYDDRPESRYHFPKMYLSRVMPLVGGWILYYESGKRGGAKAYKAIAKVEAVRPDQDATSTIAKGRSGSSFPIDTLYCPQRVICGPIPST